MCGVCIHMRLYVSVLGVSGKSACACMSLCVRVNGRSACACMSVCVCGGVIKKSG